MLGTVDAETFDSDPFASRRLAKEQELPSVYLPSPEQIEALKRQIRAENEARGTLRDGPQCLKMYREPKVLRTDYSQGRIRQL
jgi:hypothetical protein